MSQNYEITYNFTNGLEFTFNTDPAVNVRMMVVFIQERVVVRFPWHRHSNLQELADRFSAANIPTKLDLVTNGLDLENSSRAGEALYALGISQEDQAGILQAIDRKRQEYVLGELKSLESYRKKAAEHVWAEAAQGKSILTLLRPYDPTPVKAAVEVKFPPRPVLDKDALTTLMASPGNIPKAGLP